MDCTFHTPYSVRERHHRHAVPTPQTANKYQTRHCRAVTSNTVNSNFVFCVQNAAKYQETRCHVSSVQRQGDEHFRRAQ